LFKLKSSQMEDVLLAFLFTEEKM